MACIPVRFVYTSPVTTDIPSCSSRLSARLYPSGMACIRVKFDYISPVTSDIPCCFLKIVFSVDQYSSYISAMSLVDISYSFYATSALAVAHEQSQEIEKVKKEAVERVVVVGREQKLRNVSWSASFV
eukprot:scaffold382_cov138-Alexandrium_tamarense.AAC.1